MLVHRTLSNFKRIFLHPSFMTVSNLRFKMLFYCISAEGVESLLLLLIVQKQNAFYGKISLWSIGMSFHIFCEQSTSCFMFYFVTESW